jgi:hypothetical protein
VSAAIAFHDVVAESATSKRVGLTVWLSATALTEWVGDPVEAFEIPRSMLRGAQVIDHPRGANNCAALVATLHGRYARWLIPLASDEQRRALHAWVSDVSVAP